MCLYPPFLSKRPSDRNQILHTYSDRYGTHSHLNKLAPRMARKAGLIGNNLRNWTLAADEADHIGPTAWNCHLCIRVCVFPARLITYPRIFGSCLTGEFVSSKIIAFGYVTQRPTFVFASVVNAAHCKRINRITLMAVAPSGEYQSSLYLSFLAKQIRKKWRRATWPKSSN